MIFLPKCMNWWTIVFYNKWSIKQAIYTQMHRLHFVRKINGNFSANSIFCLRDSKSDNRWETGKQIQNKSCTMKLHNSYIVSVHGPLRENERANRWYNVLSMSEKAFSGTKLNVCWRHKRWSQQFVLSIIHCWHFYRDWIYCGRNHNVNYKDINKVNLIFCWTVPKCTVPSI